MSDFQPDCPRCSSITGRNESSQDDCTLCYGNGFVTNRQWLLYNPSDYAKEDEDE